MHVTILSDVMVGRMVTLDDVTASILAASALDVASTSLNSCSSWAFMSSPACWTAAAACCADAMTAAMDATWEGAANAWRRPCLGSSSSVASFKDCLESELEPPGFVILFAPAPPAGGGIRIPALELLPPAELLPPPAPELERATSAWSDALAGRTLASWLAFLSCALRMSMMDEVPGSALEKSKKESWKHTMAIATEDKKIGDTLILAIANCYLWLYKENDIV